MSKYSVEEIKKWVIATGLMNNPAVSFFAEGFGNYNFLAVEDGKKFVIRLKKTNEIQFKDSLEREFTFLSYFHYKNATFCPKPIHFYKEHNFLIEEFIEGKSLHQRDFSNRHIELFAEQLYKLFDLPVLDFETYCVENKLKYFAPESAMADLQKYGVNRFALCRSSIVGDEVIAWIDKYLHENINFVTPGMASKASSQGFCWGDVQSQVLMSGSNKMHFYDFEHVRIGNSPELSYIKIHGKFTKVQFNYLLDCYAGCSKFSKTDLLAQISREENITRVNDVIWAAMKWTEEGSDKFEQLTHKRIKLVEEMNQGNYG